MLSQLTIRNFALVDELELDLGSGLIVVTGESGAGKSILLDAIGLVLGARLSKSRMRSGVDQCEVTAEFDVADNATALGFLDQHELRDLDDPSRCLVRRVARADGRSRAFINRTPVNLGLLRELCAPLVEIHGQHEHQRLLDHRVQLQWLDDFAGASAQRDTVRESYRQWRTAADDFDALATKIRTAAERIDLLRYQVEEMDELALEDDEFDALTHTHKRLSQANDLQGQLTSVLADVQAHTDASMRSAAALKAIDDDHPALASATELVITAQTHLEEAHAELRRYDDSLQVDEQALADVDRRLTLLHDLARKHRVNPADLSAHTNGLRAELAALSVDESHLDELRAGVTAKQTHYEKAAAKLTKMRQKSAKPFAKAISHTFAQLGLADASIAMTFTPTVSEAGAEMVEYAVTTNPKYPAGTLKELASGGELARISLAIQVVAAAKSNLPCLILDEADVGVGGTTADVVGRLLRDVAEHTQVVCVTHAPQVAALGDAHLHVRKQDQNTYVAPLGEDARIEELARMLGGREVTDDTRSYARSLYEDARVA